MALSTGQQPIGVLAFACPLCQGQHQATGYLLNQSQVWCARCDVTGRTAEALHDSQAPRLDARAEARVARDVIAALRWAARVSVPAAAAPILASGSADAMATAAGSGEHPLPGSGEHPLPGSGEHPLRGSGEHPLRAPGLASTLQRKAIAMRLGDDEIPAPAMEPAPEPAPITSSLTRALIALAGPPDRLAALGAAHALEVSAERAAIGEDLWVLFARALGKLTLREGWSFEGRGATLVLCGVHRETGERFEHRLDGGHLREGMGDAVRRLVDGAERDAGWAPRMAQIELDRCPRCQGRHVLDAYERDGGTEWVVWCLGARARITRALAPSADVYREVRDAMRQELLALKRSFDAMVAERLEAGTDDELLRERLRTRFGSRRSGSNGGGSVG